MAVATVPGLQVMSAVELVNESRVLLREVTPGGNADEVVDAGGWLVVPAETVASKSFNNTSTQPERTGRTALCEDVAYMSTMRIFTTTTHVYLLDSFQAHQVLPSLPCLTLGGGRLGFPNCNGGVCNFCIQ